MSAAARKQATFADLEALPANVIGQIVLGVLHAHPRPAVPHALAASALGENDSASWMSLYNARALRAIGDLSQNQPLLTKTDILALDVLEGAKPAKLRGAFPYQSWLDLYVLAAGQRDGAWATRIARLEPCLDVPDLAAAQDKFTLETAALASPAIAAPHVCAP